MDSRYDLIVVGGGPAGSTLSTLVKKYNPSAKVLLIEKTPFPRHHIGESLLPGVVSVLKEMDAFDTIDRAGFVKKLGASYVWGKSRKPWTADFGALTVEQLIAIHGDIPPDVTYAWQVNRSRYDQILLEHAAQKGVEVREGWQACDIVEKNGKVAGAIVRSPDGSTSRLSCGFLADCSGQAGFLSRFKPVRQFDPRLKNVAAYAYFQGAAWKHRFTGHPDKTRIFVCSVPCGWFWYIPLGADLVSVGLVTTQQFLAENKITDLEAFYQKELFRCPELAQLLRRARRVPDVEATGQDFFTVKDWSYMTESAAGPGWLCAGDAAFFVDPIFSSGVTLAHLSAHRAAYSITTAWKKSAPEFLEPLWRDYTNYCRDISSGFLMLAVHWYGWDRSQSKLWRRAKEIYESRLLKPLSDRNAYTALVSGVLTGLERLTSIKEVLAPKDYAPSDAAFPDSGSLSAAKKSLRRVRDFRPKDHHIPRILYPFKLETGFMPLLGTGTLSKVPRVLFLRDRSTGLLAGSLNPRMYATVEQVRGLSLMNGKRNLGQIKKALTRRFRVTEPTAEQAVEATARNLRLWGLASFRR